MDRPVMLSRREAETIHDLLLTAPEPENIHLANEIAKVFGMVILANPIYGEEASNGQND